MHLSQLFFPTFTLFELWINSEGRNIGISETGNFEPHLYKSYKSLFKALSTRPQKRTKSDFIYCAQCYRPLSRKLDLPLSDAVFSLFSFSFLFWVTFCLSPSNHSNHHFLAIFSKLSNWAILSKLRKLSNFEPNHPNHN